MKASIALSILIACACMPSAFAIPPTSTSIEPFARQDNFNAIKMSPDGKHLAVTVPLSDHTSLVVLDAATRKQVAVFAISGKTHVSDFWWANADRLVISMAEKDGSLDAPIPTGELFGMNADGKDVNILFGYRAPGATLGTRIKSDRQENASAEVIATAPDDPDHVLIAVTPWTYSAGVIPFTSIERMDVREGHRQKLGTVPLRGSAIMADHHGHARFAYGNDADDMNRMYYRPSDDADWVSVNDEHTSQRAMWPLGFSADDTVAYVEATEPTGPDSVQRFDVSTRTLKPLLQDKSADPAGLLFADGARGDPIGVIYEDGKPRITYFDPESPAARSYRALAAGFSGLFVLPNSATTEGKVVLVEAYGDRDPGDIYRYDKVSKQAALLISHRDWFDPDKMAQSRPITFRARDGLEIHGYLTIPPGSDGKPMPMIVMPHGGPFDKADTWGFDQDVQMLATHGFSVLQPNYRGSGGRGRDFERAGYRQWGGAMQDDITDATQWAIAQGIADPKRICIYGASYGGYAALMGVAKEPALYRCAVGYVGVYDLDMMYKTGDVQENRTGKSYLMKTLGTENLASVSPAKLASRIKVPVFLAAGGADKRAPISQTREMESALKQAGVPVKKLYYPDEGHGFVDRDHVTEFDRQLLDFLDRNIGVGAQPTASVEEPAKK